MRSSRIETALLLFAGLVGIGVGLSVLFFPHDLYRQSGIELWSNSSLMSEVRAPGGSILIASLFCLMGVFSSRWREPSLQLATLMYLSYAGARIVSLVLDGIPSTSLQAALGTELLIGALCAAALVARSRHVRGKATSA